MARESRSQLLQQRARPEEDGDVHSPGYSRKHPFFGERPLAPKRTFIAASGSIFRWSFIFVVVKQFPSCSSFIFVVVEQFPSNSGGDTDLRKSRR